MSIFCTYLYIKYRAVYRIVRGYFSKATVHSCKYELILSLRIIFLLKYHGEILVLIGWHFACILNLCHPLFVYVSDMSEVLIVSGPRAVGWLHPNYWGGKVRNMGRSGGKIGSIDWSDHGETEARDQCSCDGGPPLRFDVFNGLFGSTAQGVAPVAARASIGGSVKHYLQSGLRVAHAPSMKCHLGHVLHANSVVQST